MHQTAFVITVSPVIIQRSLVIELKSVSFHILNSVSKQINFWIWQFNWKLSSVKLDSTVFWCNLIVFRCLISAITRYKSVEFFKKDINGVQSNLFIHQSTQISSSNGNKVMELFKLQNGCGCVRNTHCVYICKKDKFKMCLREPVKKNKSIPFY